MYLFIHFVGFRRNGLVFFLRKFSCFRNIWLALFLWFFNNCEIGLKHSCFALTFLTLFNWHKLTLIYLTFEHLIHFFISIYLFDLFLLLYYWISILNFLASILGEKMSFWSCLWNKHLRVFLEGRMQEHLLRIQLVDRIFFHS